ncbi:MAG: carboxypeptidase-like regulatory domain-containing protein [Planctomycetaceae bacterium]
MKKFLKKIRTISPLLTIAVTLFSVSGCGGGSAGPDERPARVQFGGTAKLNGAAIQDGLITFHPVGSGSGASGKTDSKGQFKMSTFESGDGVIPGEYNVTVVKVGAAADAPEWVPEDDPNYNGEPDYSAAAAPDNKLPPQFEDPKTSGVKVTVTEANTEFLLEFK